MINWMWRKFFDRRKHRTPVLVERRKGERHVTAKDSHLMLDNAIDEFSKSVLLVTEKRNGNGHPKRH